MRCPILRQLNPVIFQSFEITAVFIPTDDARKPRNPVSIGYFHACVEGRSNAHIRIILKEKSGQLLPIVQKNQYLV
jgi:hypothetical protein